MPARKGPCPARWIAMLAAAMLLAGCVRTTPHVVKIGLVGPFDGRYREIGYDVIPAVRLAVREWATEASLQRGTTATLFEVVAYDDGGDPAQAVEQAQALAADPDVAIVIGHWRDETTRAALPVYEQAGLPLIVFSPSTFDSPVVAANLSPSEAALHDAAAAWAQAHGGAQLLVDGSEDVEAAAERGSAATRR